VDPLDICLFARLWAAAGRYNGVVNTSLLDQVRQLSVEEQLEFVEALWDSIGDRKCRARSNSCAESRA